MAKLSAQQEKFCREYVINPNATKAAIKAGYSENSAKQQGSRLLTNDDVSKRIKQLTEKQISKDVADAQEVMEFLTRTMRGETTANQTTKDGIPYEVEPSITERIKAAEHIGKRYALFTEKHEVDGKLEIEESPRNEITSRINSIASRATEETDT